MSHLTDKQRERLLTPCECGHTINDHGSLVACWRCEDEGGECETPFEALLTARIEALLAEARAEGAREALREAADDVAYEVRRFEPGGVADLGYYDAHMEIQKMLRDRAEQIGGAS